MGGEEFSCTGIIVEQLNYLEVFHYEKWVFHYLKKSLLKYENEEIVVVATFKEPVATCGEWLQGRTTLH
jgi:hypothetical protein